MKMSLNNLVFLSALLLLPLSHVYGQVGNTNPTGVAGQFNGNVTTGCSYDPFTGNATRTVTDMVVPGAAGKYGLSYARIWNSRVGAWRNSFSWNIASVYKPTTQAMYYTVNFPDGRALTFTAANNWIASGCRERFQPTSPLAYLILPDGGKIEFNVIHTVIPASPDDGLPAYDSYTFTTSAIIDPYGQKIVYGYVNGVLDHVTEPGLRSIQFFYTTDGNMDHISSSDGRTVNYTYSTQTFSPGTTPYKVLTGVSYYGDPTLAATYTYDKPNVGGANGIPVLKTCDDPLYAGPMKKISYTYATGNNADTSAAVYGQILSENSGTTGQPVSSLAVTGSTTRVETRGDGKTRTFTYAYASNGRLTGVTDFKNVAQTQSYDAKWFVNAVVDRRGYTTNYTNNTLNGAVTQVQYPSTPSDLPAGSRGTVNFLYGYTGCPDVNNSDPNNPYYLYSVTNELGYVRTYTRDANKRVIQVSYPDGSTEAFTYNNLGQVTRKQLKNGAYQHFNYDTAGLLLKVWNPTASSAQIDSEPNTVFEYYPASDPWKDRLKKTTDPRGNVTTYEYERNATTGSAIAGRGLVSKIINPGLTYKTFGYDARSNLLWQENEKRERTNYTYDDYNRPTVITDPLTHYQTIEYYAPTGSPYSHTTMAAQKITSAEGIITGPVFDENLQITSRTDAQGSSLAATTTYAYDAAGQLTSITDPRLKTTTNVYDARNRKISSTFAPLNLTTQCVYDKTGNVLTVTRPDSTTETNTYDSLNRILTSKDPENRITTFTYWPLGTVKTVTDPKTQVTQFEYDLRGLKTKMIYPNSDYEQWTYDTAGNMTDRRAVSGQTQHFACDNRNRATDMSWISTPATPDWAHYGYDDVGRLTNANNDNSIVTLAYDAAGRLSSDTQNITGNGPLAVNYVPDNDGRIKQIEIPGGFYHVDMTYDAMGRPKTIFDQYRPNMIEYSYDAGSNVTQRKNYLNNTTLDLTPDDLGRMSRRDVRFGATTVAFDSYVYDNMSRLKTVDREDGLRDLFGYDLAGQTTSAQFGTLNGLNPQRTVSYALDNAGNRSSVVDAGTTKNYTANNLNQYTTGDSNPVTNSSAHQIQTYQGLTYNYINDRQLDSVAGNGNNYAIKQDALGRTVKRTLNGASTYYYYDRQNPIQEFGGPGTGASNVFGPGTDEIVIRFDLVNNVAASYFFYQDRLGSVTHVADIASGQVVESYRYDAFGAPTIRNGAGTVLTSSAIRNRFMFTGREYAPGSMGFYEYRARAYHPSLGRFMSEDPINFGGGDGNLFRYCANDPANGTDPSGLGLVLVAHKSNGNSNTYSTVPSFSLMSGLMLVGLEGSHGIDARAAERTWGDAGGPMGGGISSGINTPAFGLGFGSTRPGGPADPADLMLLAQIDGPQLLLLNGSPVWDPFTTRMVLAPPDFNLSDLIREAPNISRDAWWNKVGPGGAWADPKTMAAPTAWGDRPYRDLGNIVYGATGMAQGVRGLDLRFWGLAYKFGNLDFGSRDRQRDGLMIQTGIDYFDGGGR